MSRRINDDAVRAAVAEFPELAHLVDLVRGDWLFLPVVRDGVVVLLRGVRTWPNYWADAIGVRYTTDAQALRIDPAGELVWKHEGTLAEVVHSVLELPEPEARTAPRLVIGSAPPLWTPGC
jgi:hypothetical protein